jgi:hypothetical protein
MPMSTRDLSQTPSLFDTPPPPVPKASRLARDFVRWCCSFGEGFRNSPDVANLRYWARKNKLKMKERDEAEVLEFARPLFLKRVEQLMDQLTRKAETPN